MKGGRVFSAIVDSSFPQLRLVSDFFGLSVGYISKTRVDNTGILYLETLKF
jgi:hypothetical protein